MIAENVNEKLDGSLTKRRLSVLTNFRRMDGVQGTLFVADSKYIGELTGGVTRFIKEALNCDVVVLNVDTRRLFLLCLLKVVLPFWKLTLVSVDIHLSQPTNWISKCGICIKRLLLSKVDRFILYFKDFDGYSRYYGIGPEKVSYVPFKVNEWEALPAPESVSSDGSYILTAGRGLRDLPTFIEAMRNIPHPAVLLYQSADIMRAYGTNLEVDDLPHNIKMVLHDGNMKTWIDHVAGAKVVVIPAIDSIRPVGISLYPLAMALKKPVVITEGPATRGLLEGKAIIVPVGDAKALAQGITCAWEDPMLRHKLAKAGRAYAENLAGERRLLRDIIDVCGDLVSRHQSSVHTASQISLK